MTNEEYKELFKIVVSAANNIVYIDPSSKYNDYEYFLNGIYADILLNAKSALLNILNKNEASVGIDNDCRTILESLLILDMDKKGKISKRRKKLYRLSWAPIEYYNNKEIFDSNLKNKQATYSASYKQRKKTISKFCRLAHRCFKVPLKKNDRRIGYPDLYLRSKPNNPLRYSSLLKDSNIGISDAGKIYSFFSTMIHPWNEDDTTIMRKILNKRSIYIDIVLNQVKTFILENNIKYSSDEINVNDYIYSNNAFNEIIWCYRCYDFANVQANRKYGISPSLFNQLKFLSLDVYYCSLFGDTRSVVIRLKSLIERMATLLSLEHQVSLQNKTVMSCFTYGYRLRLYALNFNNDNVLFANLDSSLKNNLQNCFNNKYMNDYRLTNSNGFKTFIKEMSKSFYYPLDNQHPHIKDFVQYYISSEFTENCIPDSKNAVPRPLYDVIFDCYSKSLDMEHTSGYCYNMSTYTAKYFSINAISLSLKFVECFFNKFVTFADNQISHTFFPVACSHAIGKCNAQMECLNKEAFECLNKKR